jgi:hypothetical protein
VDNVKIVICDTLDQYRSICAYDHTGYVLPVLRGPVKWPSVDAVSFEPFRDFSEEGCHELSDRVKYAGWANQAFATDNSEIFGCNGPAAVCAALLADCLGAPLRIVDGNLIDEIRGAQTRGVLDLFLVGLPELVTDEVLFELFRRVSVGLQSDDPWEEIPRFSLITARDLASLSWLVAKVLVSARQTESAQPEKRIAYYEFPGCGIPHVRELRLNGKAQPFDVQRAETSLEDANKVLASYMEPSAVIVVATHGFEACADGGAGVVLCGLHASTRDIDEDEAGVLACARGYPCPRGPHPMPLRLIRTPVLMLASCNSLRLADSQLKPDFNLGLSFLDGVGQNYISSPATITHAQPCSVAFAAAMASGRSVAQATTLANGLLHCAGIDEPAFACIGLGIYRIRREPAAGSDIDVFEDLAPLPCEVDFGDRNHAVIFLSEPPLLELARRRVLALDLEPRDPLDRVFYFYRLERNDKTRNEGTGDHILRVFLFSFPRKLGRLRIGGHDLAGLRKAVASVVEAACFWLAFVRLCSLEEKLPQLSSMIAAIENSRSSAVRLLGNVRFDGGAVDRLRQQIRVMSSLSTLTRDLTLNYLMANVSGSFLLTNVWGEEYSNQCIYDSICNNCGGRAARKKLRHTLEETGRIVVSCWRCGFVADLPEAGPILDVSIEASELEFKGKRFEVCVRIETDDISAQSDLRVWARINAQSFGHLTPDRDCAHCELNGKSGSVLFQFDLPQGLPPHGFAIRALVASRGQIAAAARGMFVGERSSRVAEC